MDCLWSHLHIIVQSVTQIRQCHRLIRQRMIFKILTQSFPGRNLIVIHRCDVIARLKTRIGQCTTDRYRLDLCLIFIRVITEPQHITFFRRRMICQCFFFSISFYNNCDIFIFQPFQCQIRIQLSSQINLLPIKGSDQIALPV